LPTLHYFNHCTHPHTHTHTHISTDRTIPSVVGNKHNEMSDIAYRFTHSLDETDASSGDDDICVSVDLFCVLIQTRRVASPRLASLATDNFMCTRNTCRPSIQSVQRCTLHLLLHYWAYTFELLNSQASQPWFETVRGLCC